MTYKLQVLHQYVHPCVIIQLNSEQEYGQSENSMCVYCKDKEKGTGNTTIKEEKKWRLGSGGMSRTMDSFSSRTEFHFNKKVKK